MAALVLDASALAALLMPDEENGGVAERIAGAGKLYAPWLIWAELRDILIMGERRGRLTPGDPERLIEAADDLGIALDTMPSSTKTLTLARRHALTAYDALYLELAMRKGSGLVTLDRALIAAARAEAVNAD